MKEATVDGQTFRIARPETAREVLEVEVAILPPLLRQAREDDAVMLDVSRLCEWCARYTDVSADIIDRLRPAGVVTLTGKIIESVSLEPWIAEGLYELWMAGASGGCECPKCKEGRELPEKHRDKCLYHAIDDAVFRISTMCEGLDDAGLIEAPWYLYEAKTIKKKAQNAALHEERKKREKRQSIRERIKQATGRA